MADIFISYAHEDRNTAKSLAAALMLCKWSVWWDTRISAGEIWDEVIERELETARCVVVLWSKISIERRWVRTEAHEGLVRGILVPASIDGVKPPLAFRLVQTRDLSGWYGDSSHHGLRRLLQDITNQLDRKAPFAITSNDLTSKNSNKRSVSSQEIGADALSNLFSALWGRFIGFMGTLLPFGFRKGQLKMCITWFLITILGCCIGFAAASLVSEPFYVFKGRTLYVEPYEPDLYFISMVSWSLIGVCVGIGQWMFLRKYIGKAIFWIISSFVGWSSCGILLFIFDFQKMGIQRVTSSIVTGEFALCGLIIGIMQWLVIRKKVLKAGRWVLINLMLWGSMVISKPYLREPEYSMFIILILWTAIYGGISGIAITNLLKLNKK